MKPHHIFADVTLRQMADKLPITREEMLDVEGVTEYKIDNFGQQFLEVCMSCRMDSSTGKTVRVVNCVKRD